VVGGACCRASASPICIATICIVVRTAASTPRDLNSCSSVSAASPTAGVSLPSEDSAAI
jgi:hypothetical protein